MVNALWPIIHNSIGNTYTEYNSFSLRKSDRAVHIIPNLKQWSLIDVCMVRCAAIKRLWWTGRDLNARPSECESDDLTTDLPARISTVLLVVSVSRLVAFNSQ